MYDLQIDVDLPASVAAPEVSTDKVGVGEFQAFAQFPNAESPNCVFKNLQMANKRTRQPSAKMVDNKVCFHAIRQRHVMLQTSEQCQRCYMLCKPNRKVSCHRRARQK